MSFDHVTDFRHLNICEGFAIPKDWNEWRDVCNEIGILAAADSLDDALPFYIIDARDDAYLMLDAAIVARDEGAAISATRRFYSI